MYLGEMPAAGSHLTGLTVLELEDYRLDDAWVRGLASGALPNLASLRLRGCWFGRSSYHRRPTTFPSLVRASDLRHLTVLDLHMTPLGPEMIRLLAEDGTLLARLRWLSLANRGGGDSSPIGSKAVQSLAASTASAGLVHLDLSNNDLDETAAWALAASPHLRQLASLNLAHNRIGAEGALALVAPRSLGALTFLDVRAHPLPSPVRERLGQRFGPGVRYGAGRRITEGRATFSEEIPF